MTSWQSGNAAPPKSKATMLAAIGLAPVKAKLAARNTLDYTDDKGIRRIRLHDTDILTILPRGGFVIDTGGYNTVTTRARLSEFLPAGYQVGTSRGVIRLSHYAIKGEDSDMRREDYSTTEFRQRVTVNAKGKVTSDVTPAALAKARRELDAYMAAWKAKGLPSAADSGGDPWIFTAGKVDRDVMLDWVRSRYVFRKLYAMALTFTGFHDQGIAYRLHDVDRNGGALDRRALGTIRRYVRACLGGAA